MAIRMIGAAPPQETEATPEQEPLSFRDKLRAVANNPTRELSLAERIAVSAPGRWLLGTMADVGEHPVSRGVASSPVNIGATAADLYLGAGENLAELVGTAEQVKEAQAMREQVRGVADSVEQWNQQQDKLFGGGDRLARNLRGGASSITDALAVGGMANAFGAAKHGLGILAGYHGSKSYQDSIRQNPDSPGLALFHGALDAASTYIGGRYLGSPVEGLAGGGAARGLVARASAKLANRLPLPTAATLSAAGIAADTVGELATETGHYFADVAAGIEPLDWSKFRTRMADTAMVSVGAGTAAAGIHPIIDAMEARHNALPEAFESEIAGRHRKLFEQEIAAGIVNPAEPDLSLPAGERRQQKADQLATMFAEQSEQFGALPTEQKLFEIEMREQRLKQISKAATELQAASKHKPGRQVVDPGGTTGDVEPADAAKLREETLNIAEVNPAAAEEAVASRQSHTAIDAELELLAEMEGELGSLKEEWRRQTQLTEFSESQAQHSPAAAATLSRRDQLAADIENMQATIAERLSQLADQDAAVSPAIETAATRQIQPRSRAQRRIDTLTKRVSDTKAKLVRTRQDATTRRRTAEQLVKDSLSYVKAALPPSERIGLEAAASTITTPGRLDKFIQRVDQTVARYDKKLAKHSLAAALKKAEKYATRPEDRAKVDDAIYGVDLSSGSVRKRAQQLVDYINAHPEATIPPGYQQALERVNKIHVNELSTDEVRQLAESIESVAAAAANDQTFRTISRDQTIDQYASNVKSQIVANRSQASSMIGEKLSAAANAILRPEDIMRGLSEDLRVLAWENIGVEAHRKFQAFTQEYHDDMRRELNKRGLSPDRVANQTFQGGSALNAWRYEAKSIGGVSMTRSEAMHLYGLMLDPQAAAILRNGGATLEKNRLRKKSTNVVVNDGTLREIGEFIGAEGRELVEHGFSRMNTTLRDAVNEAWLATYNRPLSERDNYFPIRRDQDWIMEGKSPESFLADMQGAALKSYGEFGITKDRTQNVNMPVEVGDFFDVYSRHVDTTARIANYMPAVRDFASVYSRRDVKNAIVNATSQATYDGILEAVKQQILPVRDNDAFSRAARKLVRGSGAAVLGLRITTPFMNAIGLQNAAALYQGGDRMLASALAKMTDPAEVARMEAKLEANSPAWRQRTGDYAHEATAGMAGDSRSFQPSGLSDATLFAVSTSDKFAGIVRGFMVEDYVQNTLGIRGPEEATETAKEWERLLYRTESTSHGLEMSGALRAGRRHGLAGALTQFGSGASKTLSLVHSAKNDIANGQYKRGIRKLAAYGGAIAIEEIIRGMFSSASQDEEELFVDTMIAGAARQLPMLGDAISQSYRHARGLKVFSGPADSLTSLVADTGMAVGDVSKAIEAYLNGGFDDEGHPEYQKHALAAADRLSLLIGTLTHLPTEGVQPTAKHFANLLGIVGDDREALAAAVRRQVSPIDISEPRGKIRAALRTNDDALFLQGLEEVYAADPSRFTTTMLNGLVENQFSKVAEIEKNPELILNLTDSELKAMRRLVAERTRLRQTLQDMTSRNLGQIQEIAHPDA